MAATSTSGLDARGHVGVVDDRTFEERALQAPVPVLLEFGTTWCPPCRALEPVLERLAARLPDEVRVLRIDGDECPDLAKRYGVRGFPTVVALRGGEEIGRHVGMTQERTLLALIGR